MSEAYHVPKGTEFRKGSYWDFIDMLRRRMDQDHDVVLGIDGYEGSGKSNLALQIAKDLNSYTVPPQPFPLEHVLFDWKQWGEVFDFEKKRQVYLLDEGGNLVMSRDAMTSGNKEMLRFLTQARQLNDCIIFCMPSFFWLDKYVREHRVKWWLHVESRGRAILLERTGDWRTGETWFEDTDSEFEFGPLSESDPDYWKAYVSRKRDAFEDRFGPKQKFVKKGSNPKFGEPEDITHLDVINAERIRFYAKRKATREAVRRYRARKKGEDVPFKPMGKRLIPDDIL